MLVEGRDGIMHEDLGNSLVIVMFPLLLDSAVLCLVLEKRCSRVSAHCPSSCLQYRGVGAPLAGRIMGGGSGSQGGGCGVLSIFAREDPGFGGERQA